MVGLEPRPVTTMMRNNRLCEIASSTLEISLATIRLWTAFPFPVQLMKYWFSIKTNSCARSITSSQPAYMEQSPAKLVTSRTEELATCGSSTVGVLLEPGLMGDAVEPESVIGCLNNLVPGPPSEPVSDTTTHRIQWSAKSSASWVLSTRISMS